MTDPVEEELNDIQLAGHDLTLVCQDADGVVTYYCERCGALVQFRSHRTMSFFHVAPGHPSKISRCVELPLPPGKWPSRNTEDQAGVG